ncbi:autotransporter domain-containing protein [Mesorhizobium sp. RIZ17]|uniref:autotransporter domain-containing protein n=1 Tax=Mesorhizobium sp. RIZ17 TaxID=3132743 RepID=UPI003DA941B7
MNQIKLRGLSRALRIGLCPALLATTALSPAQAQVSDKQLTSAFQQIARGDTDFKLDSTSRIVLDVNDAALMETLTAPRGLVQNLRYATGLQLDVVVGTPGKNDIFVTRQSLADQADTLTLTAMGSKGTVSKDIGNNLLNEGYQFQSGENGLTIKYNAGLGALRGMQTITQLLLADGKSVGRHDTIAGGTGLDFPAFESREVMLDVGRLFMPVDQIIGYMEKMSLNKLNELHLHLNDNARTPDGNAFGYFRLQSDNYPGLTPPDGKFYTKEDWARLEEAAARYGVTIIPEIDTPGHSRAFNQDNPDLPWLGGTYGAFDISSDEKLQVVADYVVGVINEFRPWFKSGVFHLGGDESDNSAGQTTKYLNLLYDRIAKSDANPDGFNSIRAWSFESSGKYAGINPNIVLENWHDNAMTDKDVKWVDLVTPYYYFVPTLGQYGYTREGLDPAEAGRQFQKAIDQYVATGILPDGLFVANWNDISAAKGLSSDFINAGMSKTFPVMGLISWRGQILGPDGKVIPVETAGLENLIPISQELSSYWVRDRFPYFDGQQAMDVLMDTSRHRFIDISGEPGADHLVDGSGAKDWMGWDVEDMRKAMNGPTVLRGVFIAELAGEKAAMTTQPGSVCRDVGFALGEKKHSSCNADTWNNDITDESDAAKARIEAWNLRKVALGIENATSADEILSGVRDPILGAMPAARQLIDAVFAAATNTSDDLFNPSELLKAALAAVDADPVAKEIYGRFLNVGIENRFWQYFGSGAAKYAEFLATTSDAELAENIAVERVGPAIAEYNATQPVIDALLTKTYTPGGLLKLGPGSLRLTGDSTYSGDTLVNGGLLALDGSIVSTVTVNSAGTLGGVGRVGALVAKDGGWVSPGNSIGTLSVSGDAKLEKGSSLLVEVDGDGNSDKLAVDGKATLLGGVVMVIPEAPVLTQAVMDTLVGQTYTILTAAGGVEGTFAGAQSYYTFIGTDLAYHPGDVTLTLNRVAFADVGRTFNQQETASGIESLGAGNPIYDAILASTIDDDPASTFAALSGDIHASLKGVLIEDGRIVRDAASARVRATLGGIVTTTAATDASNDTGIAPTNWAQAYGSWASIGSDGNAAELDRKIGGFLTGTDGFIANDWRLGFLVGYANTALFGAASSANIDSYQIGVYGGTRWDAIGLSFGAAYARHDIDTTRSVAGYSAQANYSGDSVQIFGEAGYTIDTAFAVLEPFVGAAYTHLSTDGFAETNSGPYGLSGSGSSTDVTTTTLGLRASHHFSLGGTRATASGMIGWRHAVGHVTPEAALAFKGGDIFVNRGLPIARDALVFEAGFDVDLATNAKLGLSHNGQIGNGFNAHTVKTNLTIKF